MLVYENFSIEWKRLSNHKFAFSLEFLIIQTTFIPMHTVHTDGGSRWNPGPSGCAFVIADGKKILQTGNYFLWKMTNNQAEYIGAMLGLQAAQNLWIKEIHLVMDSELVIRQLQWIYKVKEPALKILNQKIKTLLATFSKVQFSSVLRERNKLADELANQAMDNEFPIYTYEPESLQFSFFE